MPAPWPPTIPPGTLLELVDVLRMVPLPISEIIGSGGGETRFTQRLRRALAERGVGNPCPLLLVGLAASLLVFDEDPVETVSDEDFTEGS